MSRELKVVRMSIADYMLKYGAEYEDGSLFDYPVEELDHILENTDIEKVALIDDRLYEIN